MPQDPEFHYRFVGIVELIDEADRRINRRSSLKMAGQRVKTLGDQSALEDPAAEERTSIEN